MPGLKARLSHIHMVQHGSSSVVPAPGATSSSIQSDVALTVVVPSVNGYADLERALDALAHEVADVPLEVLVIDRCGESVRQQVRRAFPWVRLIEAPPSATIPAMRCMAFDAARGESIAVIEDHVIVPHGWARAMLDAQRQNPVVGAAVENAATEPTLDWPPFYTAPPT